MDGALSFKEFKNGIKEKIQEEELMNIFEAVDIYKEGKLSFSVFTSIYLTECQHSHNQANIYNLDKNHFKKMF